MKTIAAVAAMLAVLALGGTELGAMGGDPAPPAADADSAKEDFAAGKQAVQAGQYDRAIELMKKVVVAEPKNADAYNYLGFAHRKKGDVKPAASYYETALKIDPDHKGALEYQGELFLKLGRLDDALRNRVRLQALCPKGCTELSELDRAIADHKATTPGSST